MCCGISSWKCILAILILQAGRYTYMLATVAKLKDERMDRPVDQSALYLIDPILPSLVSSMWKSGILVLTALRIIPYEA